MHALNKILVLYPQPKRWIVQVLKSQRHVLGSHGHSLNTIVVIEYHKRHLKNIYRENGQLHHAFSRLPEPILYNSFSIATSRADSWVVSASVQFIASMIDGRGGLFPSKSSHSVSFGTGLRIRRRLQGARVTLVRAVVRSSLRWFSDYELVRFVDDPKSTGSVQESSVDQLLC